MVGSNGNVISFDIQDIAIENTEKLLKESNLEGVARLYKTSHENMPDYAEKESISAIMFNLGYLPKGDHKISTKSESTINAISKGLDLLKPGGVMSICIYSGKDSGFRRISCTFQRGAGWSYSVTDKTGAAGQQARWSHWGFRI